jgi:hypothetical protein
MALGGHNLLFARAGVIRWLNYKAQGPPVVVGVQQALQAPVGIWQLVCFPRRSAIGSALHHRLLWLRKI